MNNHQFKMGNSIYIIIVCIFIFGVFLEITQTDFILKTYTDKGNSYATNQEKEITIPSEILNGIEKQPFLIIYDNQLPESVALKDNIKQTLSYMKQLSEEVTVDSMVPKMNNYKMVIVTLEDIDRIKNLDEMISFVANGGKVFFSIRPDTDEAFYKLMRKIGVFEVGGFIDTKGVFLTSNVLIKQKNLDIKDDFLFNSSLAVSLDSNSTIHMKSSSNGTPLLWDIDYDLGKFMVFNGTMLTTKDNRGLIAGAIGLLLEDFMYPILNMKLTYLDDFPAPIPKGYNDKIYQELKLDIPTFYRNVWWPFMQKQSAKYDLKYTGVVIQTYNNTVSSPFTTEHDEENHLVKYGRELLKIGGEIGIHGYNHQSLVTSQKRVNHLGYKAWPNESNMAESLRVVENHIKEVFPDYKIVTYVPPSNVLDENGVKAIVKALPTISNISSVYLSDEDQTVYSQEFGMKDGISHLPRLTSGFEYSGQTKWTMVNGISGLGVFSHFVHPDDILDEERTKNKGWNTISEGLTDIFNNVDTKYPWLRSMTASEATTILKQYEKAEIYIVDKADRKIGYINHFNGEYSFILRTNKKIGNIKNCSVKPMDDNVYFVEAKKEIFEIELR